MTVPFSFVATSLSDAGQVQIWDVGGSPEAPLLHAGTGSFSKIGYSVDGRHLQTITDAGDYQVWDAETGKDISVVVPPAVIAFSNDGEYVLAESGILGNVTTGEAKHLPLQDEAILTAAFSPDGAYLVTVDTDDLIRLWDTTTLDRVGPDALPADLAEWGAQVAFLGNENQVVYMDMADHPLQFADFGTGPPLARPTAAYTKGTEIVWARVERYDHHHLTQPRPPHHPRRRAIPGVRSGSASRRGQLIRASDRPRKAPGPPRRP